MELIPGSGPASSDPLAQTLDPVAPNAAATADTDRRDQTVMQDASARTAAVKATVRSLGNYELIRELGRGGMGAVHLARDPSLKRLVAIKVILSAFPDPQVLARFRTEAESVAQLQHPNIVQVYEVGERNGHPYLALEYVGGGSLSEILDGKPWPGKEAAALVRTLALAMHHAHQRGIVHRDLKPANILLSFPNEMTPAERSARRGEALPKISDFGLAKKLDENQGLSQTGSVLGTPSYMSPEQAEGKVREVGPASDTYALGVVLYELLTGRVPFKGSSLHDTVLQVIRDEPSQPRTHNPRIDRDLQTICLKCLQKSPAKRYASALELAADLERYERGEPIQARPIGRIENLVRWCRRNPARALATGIMLVCLAVVLVGGAVFHQKLSAQLSQTEKAQAELQMTLTSQAAERLDGDLNELSGIPEVAAATLEVRGDWTRQQLDSWLRDILVMEPHVHGLGVALEPGVFEPGLDHFAIYVCRGPKGLQTKMLDPDVYKPIYREWDWYKKPRDTGKPAWSEPYVDVGGGDVPMITYSVPIRRDGKFVGVVEADLSLDHFDVLYSWLKDMEFCKDSYAFIVSPTGAFIRHPDPSCGLPARITSHPAFQRDAALLELGKRMLAREKGRVAAVDPWSGRPSQFLFAPIRISGWSLCVVLPDKE